MRICIEAQTLNHQQRSGLMTYTEGLVNSLCRSDRENDYSLLYYSLRRSGEEMPGPIGINFKKVVLRLPDREFFARNIVVDKITLPLYFLKNKVNIFHRANGYTMPSTKNVFKVLTVHDLRTLTIGDQEWKQNIDHYKKTLAMVDMCVVVSECTKRDLIQHFQLDEKKIKVIYLGASDHFRPSAPKEIEALKLKFKLDSPFILSIGSVPRKNLDGIIRAFKESKAAKDFFLVMSCNQDVEKYRNLAKELGIGDRVKVLSRLSDEDIVRLYSGCHFFLFPSLYEGFGLPLVEAMRCGAPIVTSNVSSCPEVAGDAAILVDPNKLPEITEAINLMCDNSALRQTLIQKGFERAKFFSWDIYGQEMKKVYAMAHQ